MKTVPELRQLLCCLAMARPWVASAKALAKGTIVELPVAPRPRAPPHSMAAGTDDPTVTAGISAHDEFVKRLRGEIAVIDADRQQQHGDDQRARLPRVVSLRDADSAMAGKRRPLNTRLKALGSTQKLRGAEETERLGRLFVHREPADMPRFKNPTAASK